jgi:hypothetical protein
MKQLMILTLTMFVCSFTFAQERTTSEVKRDFQKQLVSLMKSLSKAESAEEVEKITAKVDAFENEYKPYKDFLNNAVFPDGYDGNIEKVKEQATSAKNLVEGKKRIAELEAQITSLTGQVDSLTNQNSSLLAQLITMKKERESERAELKKVIAQLQDNIRKRDDAILSLVDNLFSEYEKNSQLMKDVDKHKMASLEKNNVLGNIKRSIQDNMNFLTSTALSGSDIVRLYEEQGKFAAAWKTTGPRLANAYISAPKDRAREVAAIDTMLSQWKQIVDDAFWKQLNAVFASANLAVAPFTSGESFYNNILRFIDDETNNVSNIKSEDRFKTYTTFADVWGKDVKPAWTPAMKQHQIITDAQIAEIDTKTQLWYAKVKPTNALTYILACALVLAVLVGIYLGMRKKPIKAA